MTRRAKHHPEAASHKGQESCTKATLKPLRLFHCCMPSWTTLWTQPAKVPGMHCSPCPQQQARLQSKCLVSIVVPCL